MEVGGDASDGWRDASATDKRVVATGSAWAASNPVPATILWRRQGPSLQSVFYTPTDAAVRPFLCRRGIGWWRETRFPRWTDAPVMPVARNVLTSTLTAATSPRPPAAWIIG